MSELAVEGVLGRGQFGVVYRARTPGGARVALKKVFMFQLMEDKARADCLNEIALLQKLDHENVIKYMGSWVEDEELNILLELAECGDLARLIHQFRRHRKLIPERTIWRYFGQAAAGLHHMHSKRIMHRDIKPANIFVTREGVVKLGDLGLSRFFSARTMAAHTLVGTPYYMSPERITEQGYTFSSDIWSLGCILYELGALQSPFYGHTLNLYSLTKKIENGIYPPLPGNTYSREMKKLISDCLKAEPRERPTIDHIHSVSQMMIRKVS